MLCMELLLSLRRDEVAIVIYTPEVGELGKKGTWDIFQGRREVADNVIG